MALRRVGYQPLWSWVVGDSRSHFVAAVVVVSSGFVDDGSLSLLCLVVGLGRVGSVVVVGVSVEVILRPLIWPSVTEMENCLLRAG